MKPTRNMLIIGAVVAICLVVARLAMSIPGSERSYEVEPQVTSPEYRTDAARAIDAYERLMERYMDMTAKHLLQVGADCQAVAGKLDSLDSRLAELSARLARIEKALGIEPPVASRVEPNTSPADKVQPSPATAQRYAGTSEANDAPRMTTDK
jgi:hypothetical protein